MMATEASCAEVALMTGHSGGCVSLSRDPRAPASPCFADARGGLVGVVCVLLGPSGVGGSPNGCSWGQVQWMCYWAVPPLCPRRSWRPTCSRNRMRAGRRGSEAPPL